MDAYRHKSRIFGPFADFNADGRKKKEEEEEEKLAECLKLCIKREKTRGVHAKPTSPNFVKRKTRRVSKSLFPTDDLTCNDLIKRVTETDSMPRFVPGINNRHQPIGTSSLTTVQSGSSDPINERERERERLAPQTPRPNPPALPPSFSSNKNDNLVLRANASSFLDAFSRNARFSATYYPVRFERIKW